MTLTGYCVPERTRHKGYTITANTEGAEKLTADFDCRKIKKSTDRYVNYFRSFNNKIGY